MRAALKEADKNRKIHKVNKWDEQKNRIGRTPVCYGLGSVTLENSFTIFHITLFYDGDHSINYNTFNVMHTDNNNKGEYF